VDLPDGDEFRGDLVHVSMREAKRVSAAFIALLWCLAASASPNVLTVTPASVDSGYTNVAAGVNAVLGTGKIDNPIYNDICNFCSILTAISAAVNTSASYISIASSTTVNHAPYAVSSGSWTIGPTYPTLDPDLYVQAIAGSVGMVEPLGSKGATLTKGPPSATAMLISSQNSQDGGSTWGIELGLSTSYLGLNTIDDSHAAPAAAGMLAALLYNHPSWNSFDARVALRTTASLWATGYSHTGFGYGYINWSNANSASTLYLQPPGYQVQNNGWYLQFTLYPFRQTRRSYEVIYSVNASYSWPVKNEYTTSDITASGGTLIYTSNGSDVTPTFNYTLAAPGGTVTLVAFTTDGMGNYSRVEEFSETTQMLLVGTSCSK
jgi:hypothetical protein